MSIIINEKQMVEDNIFQFEERLKAPSSRFIDSTQTYVDYYHIDNEGTTTDAGFIDVASILGFQSSLMAEKFVQKKSSEGKSASRLMEHYEEKYW